MASGFVLITASWLKMLFKHSSVLQISLKISMNVNFLCSTETLYMKVSVISQLAKIKS